MKLLMNTWYVAAWGSDLVHGKPLGRTLLNEPLVLMRLTDGTPVALSDLCPHRFAPLHMGKQIGDVIQCGYHGLEFGANGHCVRNPHGKDVPPNARVKRYPLAERYGLVWIWFGDAPADEALIPDEFSFLGDDQRYTHVRTQFHAKANYLLMLDNLMDVSHALYLHAGSLTSEDMRQDYDPKVELVDGITSLVIHLKDQVPPGFWAKALPPGTQRVDVRETSRGCIPAMVMHEMVYMQPGRAPYSEGGVSSKSAHFYTPETDGTMHYFYAFSRDFYRDSPEFGERLKTEVERIFTTEDFPMIEAQQKLVGDRDLMTMKPALLHTDLASVMMRRHLSALIAKETGA